VKHEVNPARALARHAFFAALDADVLDAVVRRAVLRLYEKGALIYVEGETVPGIYIVVSGTVRLFRTSEDGREQDLFHVSASESLNDASAFDGKPTIATAQAIEPTMLVLISRDALAALMRDHHQIATAVIREMAGRLRDLARLAGDLSLRRVISRMAGVLLRLADIRAVAELPTRNELAAMVGTVREVATRTLRQLEAAGALRLEGRSVSILDRGQLERLSGERWPGTS
jgi:CRP/FNR family transcriptional regulator, cyclic AMP receptor protein